MPDYQVQYGSASTALRVELPDSYSAASSPTVSVYDTDDGTAIVSATAGTVYAGDTLAAAAAFGAATIVLTAGTAVVNGDLLKIASSTAGPAETVRVLSYVAGDKTVTLQTSLLYDHASGTAVTGRWVSYTLDASSATNYPADTELAIAWTVNATNLVLTQTAVVLKRVSEEIIWDEFSDLYPHYAEQIPSGKFDLYKNDAYRQLRSALGSRGRTLEKLVDGTDLTHLLMAQIAYHIAMTRGDTWDNEATRMNRYLTDAYDQFCASNIWIDEDQDLIKEEEEEQPSDMLPVRQLW